VLNPKIIVFLTSTNFIPNVNHPKKDTKINKGKSTLIKFLKEIVNSDTNKNLLILNLSSFKTFNSLDFKNSSILTNEEELRTNKNKYDYIIGDLPFGLNRVGSLLPFKQKLIRIGTLSTKDYKDFQKMD